MKAYIKVIGPIWWPVGEMAAGLIDLTPYDIENIRDYGDGTIDRDAVELWLGAHSGGFQNVSDFTVYFPSEDIDIQWASEESEFTYNDAMFGDEE